MAKVLITGGGGSIGSALARRFVGEEVTIFEMSEAALYAISEELPAARAILGDVKDTERLKWAARGAQVVFHCAAYKHVHMLEGDNASEARKNNVLGTQSALEATKSAAKFVLLSTDKACNPVSELGHTKYEAERLTLAKGRTASRLGNVWGSSGSVIPKWERQISAGGPLTLTHPEATRYFVTMNEAVSFLCACAERKPGLYTMPMRPPRRMLDVARTLIGERDIEIVYTGLRPGEKLHEELEAA